MNIKRDLGVTVLILGSNLNKSLHCKDPKNQFPSI